MFRYHKLIQYFWWKTTLETRIFLGLSKKGIVLNFLTNVFGDLLKLKFSGYQYIQFYEIILELNGQPTEYIKYSNEMEEKIQLLL